MLKNIWNKPLDHTNFSREKLKNDARRRMATINSEFRHTFKFLLSYPRSVTVFGSARFTEDHPCYERARALASRISKETGYAIVSGGGGGIMEAANRGAFEAGGKSIGMNIILPHEQKLNQYVTANIRFYYFFIRKVALSFSAEAYIFFPGGFGTMDEFFEIITLMQTRKIAQAPIICVGTEFWGSVMKLIGTMRDDFKTISPGDENIFKIVEDDAEVIRLIKETPLRKI
ncbi:MAG: TIGR00730 family Rossman fold protein [Candidatus Paceibacterota bacterium]|jgi:hypothetical protein